VHRVRLFLAALAFLVMASVARGEAGNEQSLRLASDVWPPFTDVEGKSRRAIALIEAALDRSKIPTSTTITTWEAVIAGLMDDTFDGCAAIWRTSEREEFLLFSKPYLENRLVLVGRSGAPVEGLRISDLKDKRLAVVEGYAYGTVLDKPKGVHIVFGKSDAANLEAVLAGKADYMLADELLVHRLFESYPEKSRELLAAASTPLVQRPLHFAVRRNLPNAAAIIQAFDQNIQTLIADGTYNRLLELAWIRSDITGDGVEDYITTGTVSAKAPETSSAYRLFESTSQSADPNLSPSYVVDGKSYLTWDEASVQLEPLTPRVGSETVDEAGLVLLRF
jgi:polar amino acid transport system substrate-binding protein